jgi:hypothetical protein
VNNIGDSLWSLSIEKGNEENGNLHHLDKEILEIQKKAQHDKIRKEEAMLLEE